MPSPPRDDLCILRWTRMAHFHRAMAYPTPHPRPGDCSLVPCGVCRYLMVSSLSIARLRAPLVFFLALAFPPLFHFFVRGQISALVLICFTAAFLAFRADLNGLAGIALGFLVFKPQ